MSVIKPYWEADGNRIYCGNVLDTLNTLPEESVQMCVTSPPYWGLRDYDIEPQIWNAPEGCDIEWGDELCGKEGYHEKIYVRIARFDNGTVG